MESNLETNFQLLVGKRIAQVKMSVEGGDGLHSATTVKWEIVQQCAL